MRERTVLVLVVVLTLTTAGAGVAVNMLRASNSSEWHAFDLSVSSHGTASLISPVEVTVNVRQALVDPKTLWVVFLSLDTASLDVQSSTPASNPWGYPTVWNITALDLTVTRSFNVTGVPTVAGSTVLYAMVWVPRGDLRTVQIDPTGHVNPAEISVMAAESLTLWVSTPS